MKAKPTPKMAKPIEGPIKVAGIVPVRNEEERAGEAIRTLHNQAEIKFEAVWVVINNSTDRTEEICRELQKEFGEYWLRIVVMKNNPDLKAGAMNEAYRLISEDPVEFHFVFAMDGDAIVGEEALKSGVNHLRIHPEMGATSAVCALLPLDKILKGAKPTLENKLLWNYQNIEYSLFNPWRVQNYQSVRVLPGVGSLFRMETLDDVYRWNIARGLGPYVWMPGSRAEDYLLTLAIKDGCEELNEAGWGAMSTMDMYTWTDCPLTWKELFSQRERWNGGNVDIMRERGLKKNSRSELMIVSMMPIKTLLKTLLVVIIAWMLSVSFRTGSNPLGIFIQPFLILPIVHTCTVISRLRRYGTKTYGTDKSSINFTQLLIAATINGAYEAWRTTTYYRAIYRSFARTRKEKQAEKEGKQPIEAVWDA